MAWVSSLPLIQLPVPLTLNIGAFCVLPHTPLAVLVSTTSIVVLHAQTLLPVATHTRSVECIEIHGHAVDIQLCHVAVALAQLEKMSILDVHVRTKQNYVLVFHVSVNYGKSLYEVVDSANTEAVLQTNLPLAANNAKNSLSSMFKSATRSLIHGSSMGSNMASVEHFENSAVDDEQRNSYIPLVKVALVKILRLSAPISWFWCKPNSRNVIFFNNDNKIQLLNSRTLKSQVVPLLRFTWYYDSVLVQYNPNYNCFLHVNSLLELAVLEFSPASNATDLSLTHTLLTKLDSPAENIQFNPQSDLVLIKTEQALYLYTLSCDPGKPPRFRLVKTLVQFERPASLKLGWSPCGEFFFCIDLATHFWKLFSAFGCVRFDSAAIASEVASAIALHPSPSDDIADFCKISSCTISSNAQCLYLVNSKLQTLYKVNLLRPLAGQHDELLFYDANYISKLDTRGLGSFVRFPIPPFAQKFLTDMQWINGISLKKVLKKPTGIFTGRINKYKQLSLAHGDEIAISTPICNGLEYNQVYWFQFYNHFVSLLNVIDHIWIDGYLLLVNRIPREDSVPELTADLMVDELLLLDTRQSKNGAGGVKFKFDSDLICWRHTFKNQILHMEASEELNTRIKTLTLVTHDMKIIIVDFDIRSISLEDVSEQEALEPSKISIKVRRTIHLSSIRHKLPLFSLKRMFTIADKHFFFLLDNGDCFLLKNQAMETSSVNGNSLRTQTSNMYDLIQVNSAVEKVQISPIEFDKRVATFFITLYKGDDALTYDLQELLDRPYDFEDAESSEQAQVAQKLQPVKAHTTGFSSIQIYQTSGTVCISGFENQVLWKNENLIIKQKPGRLLILDKFIHRDLFDADLDKKKINNKYSGFKNYTYCLELLLFEQLEFIDKEGAFEKVCELVNVQLAADTIYVNFLRKIEAHFWDKFFQILNLTPIEFMNKLIGSQNVDLCYNYLNIYLNFKREHERGDTPENPEKYGYNLLGDTEQMIILEIVEMLKNDEKWDECFELCRFIKLLEPLGQLLVRVRASIAS